MNIINEINTICLRLPDAQCGEETEVCYCCHALLANFQEQLQGGPLFETDEYYYLVRISKAFSYTI